MPELLYYNESTSNIYISEWLFIADVNSVKFTILSSVNCNAILDWAINDLYDIITTDNINIIGNTSTELYHNIKSSYVRLTINNYASTPLDLKINGFFF